MKKEEKYINPLTDFGFKKIFGTELNKELLIDFLNEILPNRQVKDLSYSTNEHFGKYEIDEHKQEKDLLHVVELKNQKCEVFYDKLKFI